MKVVKFAKINNKCLHNMKNIEQIEVTNSTVKIISKRFCLKISKKISWKKILKFNKIKLFKI